VSISIIAGGPFTLVLVLVMKVLSMAVLDLLEKGKIPPATLEAPCISPCTAKSASTCKIIISDVSVVSIDD
jgi:hypothetical protein